MKVDIIAPAAGESVTEGDIARWFKDSGEAVTMDEPLLEIETDKASLEVAAEVDGVLEILAEEGSTVAVGSVIGRIDTDVTPEPPVVLDTDANDDMEDSGTPLPLPEVDKAKTSTVANLDMPSPAARKLMTEHRISSEDITGTGKGGRITKADVIRFLDEQNRDESFAEFDPTKSPYENASPVVAPDETIVLYPDDRSQEEQGGGGASQSTVGSLQLPSLPVPPAPSTRRPAATTSPTAAPQSGATVDSGDGAASRAVRREKLSRIRRTIATRLVDAQQSAALLTTFNEIDMSAIMDIRQRYKEEFKDVHQTGLGFMSFFTKACCHALAEFPEVNAQIDDDHVLYHDYCDIGIAVSTPRGLVVPVIRNAERLSFHAIEATIRELATKGRDNQLTPDDLTGGTFTITNGGTFGSMLSTPIVNRPQSGILGMHNIVERPVAIDGQVVIRPIMYAALTYDHRLIDGAGAVRFLVKVKQLCEDPTRLMLQL